MRVPRVQGFTMVELLVVIGLAALLLALAVPNLRPQVTQATARSVAGDMADGLRYARQYALNTSGVVTFTPNGCGYSVADASGTQLQSASSTSSSGVSCQALSSPLTFLGDGSVSVCTQGSSGTTCTQPKQNQVAFVTGAGQTWSITVTPGGIVSSSAP